MELYIVRPGDTVDSIARETGTPVDSLIYANQLPYPYRLAVGQALLYPLALPVIPAALWQQPAMHIPLSADTSWRKLCPT